MLKILDPSINTLPYLYTLLAHIGASQNSNLSNNVSFKAFSPSGPIWLKMLDFMDRFDPVQIRYVGYDWRRLVENVARVAENTSKVRLALTLRLP